MQNSTGYIPGKELDPMQLDENTCWQDTIETLASELEEAGVVESETRRLAEYFYAAFVKHQAILLLGPSGRFIADAVSAAVCGKTAAQLDCSLPYSADMLEFVRNTEDEILVVKNLFNGNWVAPLMELIQSCKKQIMVVHPFSEDIYIEPASMFNYLLPMFTEQFIYKETNAQFIGGKKVPNIGEEKKTSGRYSFLRKLRLNRYQTTKLTEIVKILETINSEEFTEVACRYICYPLACLLGKIEQMRPLILEMKLSKETKELFIPADQVEG